jgi:hypothetical protein
MAGKYKGVRHRKRARAWEVYVKGKFVSYHRSEDDAARAYNEAALKAFGPFAKLNTIAEEC